MARSAKASARWLVRAENRPLGIASTGEFAFQMYSDAAPLTIRGPGGGHSGMGLSNSFVGDTNSVAAASGMSTGASAAAGNLFAHLRAADRAGPAAIAVAPIPQEGLGEAINDRLRRAAGFVG